jgi:hypothetical protein
MFSALWFSELTTDNIILREARGADLSNWSYRTHYEYLQKMSTTSLHPHIEKYHLDLYMTLVVEKEWKILLLGLVSNAQSQATNEAARLQGE